MKDDLSVIDEIIWVIVAPNVAFWGTLAIVVIPLEWIGMPVFLSAPVGLAAGVLAVKYLADDDWRRLTGGGS